MRRWRVLGAGLAVMLAAPGAVWAAGPAVAGGGVAGGGVAGGSVGGGGVVVPVPGAMVGAFDPPEERWGVGHRGVDLAAEAGTSVVAPRAGVVTFAGRLVDRGVLVIAHGDTRTTLEPVQSTVAVGATVAAGEVVGVLEAGHACGAATCLHWGLKRGEEYLDPLVGSKSPVRLLPAAAAAGVKARAAARSAAAVAEASGAAPTDAGGVLLRPAGRLGSRFGPRFHPIFHEWRPHRGVDLSSPCGSPIHAAGAGTVTRVGYDSSGGWRLVIAHPEHGGRSLSTVYLHAQGYSVRPGDRVTRGQVVGRVGSTGWSTGCHLHFSVKLGGRHVDPEKFW